MAVRIQHLRGTAAQWAALNPVLKPGELGFEKDTKIIKLGDGVTPWNSLNTPYLMTSGGVMTGALELMPPTQPTHAARKIDVDNLPQGILGIAQKTSNQGGIGSTETDITDLTLTLTPPNGHRIRVMSQIEIRSTVTDDRLVYAILRDGSQINGFPHYVTVGSASLGNLVHVEGYILGDGNEHTFKSTLVRTSGSGTAGVTATGARPGLLVVEDVGVL